jgi:hypothetical protein
MENSARCDWPQACSDASDDRTEPRRKARGLSRSSVLFGRHAQCRRGLLWRGPHASSSMHSHRYHEAQD